jgi:hypothetical protein
LGEALPSLSFFLDNEALRKNDMAESAISRSRGGFGVHKGFLRLSQRNYFGERCPAL